MQNWIPRTLLPSLSRGGDQHTMPITLGTTSRMPPETPDLAGRPTYRTTLNLSLLQIVKMFVFHLKVKPSDISPGVYVWNSHGRRTVRKSRTCRRSALDSECFVQPRGSVHARLWLDRSRRSPGWLPSHWHFRRLPQWSTAKQTKQSTFDHILLVYK